MIKVLKIAAWVIFIASTTVLTVLANSSVMKIGTNAPVIKVDRSNGSDFVTEEILLEKLNNLGYRFNGQQMHEIELGRIEEQINAIPGVKHVEAYKYLDGNVEIEVTQRRPIARVILSDGMIGYYLDEEGEIIPLSEFFVAKVPVFSGALDDKLSKGNVANLPDSSKLKYTVDDVFEVAKAIDQNEFLHAQVLQVYVTPKHEFELIPRVGNHRILFGDATDAELKVKKLEKFYTEAITPEELNLYDTLNVKYYNQLICSKR